MRYFGIIYTYIPSALCRGNCKICKICRGNCKICRKIYKYAEETVKYAKKYVYKKYLGVFFSRFIYIRTYVFLIVLRIGINRY